MEFGSPNVRFDFAALYRALDEKRRSRALSWQQAAREVGRGISPSTLRRTSRGGPMEADGVLAMIRWLGLNVQDFAGEVQVKEKPAVESSIRGRRFDTMAFYRALDEKRAARGMTWKQVALELTGFSPTMLTRLSKRGRMSIEQVVELSAWLGSPPETFTHSSKT